jgi:hypothetical protein
LYLVTRGQSAHGGEKEKAAPFGQTPPSGLDRHRVGRRGSDLDAYTDAAQDRFIPFLVEIFPPVSSLTSPIALLARAPRAAIAKQVDERQQSHGATPAKQRPGEREAVVTGR